MVTEASAADPRVRCFSEVAVVSGPEEVDHRVLEVVKAAAVAGGVLAVGPWRPEGTEEWLIVDQEFGKTGFSSPQVSMPRTVPTIPTASTARVPRDLLLLFSDENNMTQLVFTLFVFTYATPAQGIYPCCFCPPLPSLVQRPPDRAGCLAAPPSSPSPPPA